MSKLLVIVGPTASGKSDLAMALAQKYNGEIICADSRTVYRYMNLGTAKPSPEDMLQIPHHLLDLIDPGEEFSAAEFKELAVGEIEQISRRRHLPIMVGGTGLYIDSVLFDYSFPEPADAKARAKLEKLSDSELSRKLEELDPAIHASVDLSNRRRVIRAIETVGQDRSRSTELRPDSLVLGITVNKNMLQKRIEQRIEKMLSQGLIAEVKALGKKFGWESEAMTGIGYRAFKDHILGRKSLAEAKAEFVHGDLMLAKKQLTWFKRNPHIKWVESQTEAEELVANFLG